MHKVPVSLHVCLEVETNLFVHVLFATTIPVKYDRIYGIATIFTFNNKGMHCEHSRTYKLSIQNWLWRTSTNTNNLSHRKLFNKVTCSRLNAKQLFYLWNFSHDIKLQNTTRNVSMSFPETLFMASLSNCCQSNIHFLPGDEKTSYGT